MLHRPVLLEEVIQSLALQPGAVVVDGTVGSGGHAEAILKIVGPQGHLIGIDQDREAIERAKERLASFGDQAILVHENFEHLDQILERLHLDQVDGVLFDLGVSSEQLASPERGLSFQFPGPLDMRMDHRSSLTAAMVVNRSSQAELESLLATFGEEPAARRIAQAICEARKKRPIETTQELRRVIHQVIRRRGRIDPATKSFQAFRIAVNRELEVLGAALRKAVAVLRAKGRLCVISFHSLEDRVVKHSFRRMGQEGLVRLVTKKPIRPSPGEARMNPRSRSARLRVVERVG